MMRDLSPAHRAAFPPVRFEWQKKRPPVSPAWMKSRSGEPEGRGAAITRKSALGRLGWKDLRLP